MWILTGMTPILLLLTKHNDRNYILKMESCELLTRLVDMDEEITAEIDSGQYQAEVCSTLCAELK